MATCHVQRRQADQQVYNRHNRLVSLTGELEQRDFPLKVVFLEAIFVCVCARERARQQF